MSLIASFLPASLLTLAGIAGVRLAWHYGRTGHKQRQVLCRFTGWGLLVLSLWPWMAFGGTDRGVALDVMVMMLAGLLLIAWAGWRAPARRNGRNGNGREASLEATHHSTRGAASRRFLVFMLAGPISAGTAMLLTLSLNGFLQGTVSAANQLATVLLFFPVAWMLLAMLASYDMPLRRRSAVIGSLFGVALISSAWIVFAGGAT